ncbi:MAG TPA: ABC transporter permease [Chitinophagaceae bacterium]
MFSNYFKTAFRQLLRNKLFSIVNIVGLSTGFAGIMALSILVYQYITADDNQKDISEMYYLKTLTADGGQYTSTTYPLLGEIVKTCPEVAAATHIQHWHNPWLKYNGKEFQETTSFVDTGYFKVFPFPFSYGNPATALKDKYSIVLSKEIAEKFFGDKDPVGKIITADDTLQLRVTGVLRHVPSNSTMRPTVVLPTALLEDNPDFRNGANWYNGFARNYLRLKNGSDPKKLDAEIAGIVKLNYAPGRKGDKVFAVPFSKISQENGALIPVIIKGAAGAGIFILLIILVNLINLNTASLYSRAKEVAVRQMIGGSKKGIVLQFCFENGLIVLISVILAWILFSLLLLPGINDLVRDKFGEIEPGISRDYPLMLLFAGIGLLFTVLAASLPAWRLASVKVADTVKGRLASGNYKNGSVRNIFITIQFVLAITLICITIILNRQINYMKTAAPGFNKDNVAVVNLDLAFRDRKSADTRFESILNDLKNNPHVKSVSTNGVIPTAYYENFNIYYDPATGKEVRLRHAGADAGYLPTYQVPLIQGKNFDDALAASEKSAIIINRSAMKAFGWTDAVGKQIKQKGNTTIYTVVGVMEDFHYSDLQNPIEPLLQWYAGKPSLENRYLSVRIYPGYVKPVMKQLEKAFKSMPSRRNFSYEMMSDKVDGQYALLSGILKVTDGIALLTILIASMGLFGLVSLFAKQRIKEIGIRKVLGANVAGIVQLLSGDFLLLIGIAIVIASPIAWYIMKNWLQDFAYHISIQWWMFAIAGTLALLISLITVSFQTVKAAVANPVESLRSE